jgi:hypothetical protein
MSHAAVIERKMATTRASRMLAAVKSPRKAVVIVAAAGIIAATGGAAYAYWTSGGSGSATATAGTTSAVTITGTTAASIYPGGSFTVTLKANNPNSSTVKIGTVSATAFTSNILACTTLINDATYTDFSMDPVAEDQTLAANTNNISLTNNGSLVFNDVAQNQDACKGAVITVTLSATAGA